MNTLLKLKKSIRKQSSTGEGIDVLKSQSQLDLDVNLGSDEEVKYVIESDDYVKIP